MDETEEKIEKLRRVAEAGLYRFNQDGSLDSRYVTVVVGGVLNELIIEIANAHRFMDITEGETTLTVHYTSVFNLISMIEDASNRENASLRLYDSAYLNDPEEGDYFVRHLDLPGRYTWLGENASHAYITSFIIPNLFAGEGMNASDNLVFWRTYGMEGEGCSLKLNIPSHRLHKVCYGPDKVKCTGDILLPALDSLHGLAEVSSGVQEELAETVWECLGRIRYLYKSKAYEYEGECRIVMPEPDIEDKDKIRFEYSGQNGVPAKIRHYYENEEFRIKEVLSTGSSITLGPCVPYAYNAVYLLKHLLRKAEISDDPEIKISDILYRRS